MALYLKSLEIQGFKSFPDKTRLDFSSGITAIVGPNGSGKSNLVDAIRWVLGEQSTRNLRGSRMEDVVFGGTQRRRPLGYCEVTLTVDNGDHSLPLDYDEVAVTRRYYRSGESEFFINKKPVRLKDVHELLMDTGLGREGYSIIGQGRIDEILAVKSGERREIFEEAAGITRYRYKRNEAQRRLSAAEDNLVRIRDIITELHSQVGPLEKQAQDARQFLLLRDELRVLEVSLWMDSLAKLGENRQKTKVDLDNAQRMLSARGRELEELYAEGERLIQSMRDKELETEQSRVELRNIEGQIHSLDSDIAVLGTQRENGRQNARRLERELELHATRQDGLVEQKTAQEQQREESRKILAAKEQELAKIAHRQQELAEHQQEQTQREEAAREELNQSSQQLHQLEIERAALESGCQEMESRGKNLESELSRAKERLEKEEGEAKNLETLLEQGREQEESAGNMLEGFLLRVRKRREKAQKLLETYQEEKRALGTLSDRSELLQALERDYEGFGRAVRQTLEAARKGVLSGIHGPVSQLISVGDEHAVAIEIALGAAMSNIVTKDEESAKQAIGFLKSRDLGRATFLPVSAMAPRKTDGRPLESEPGFVGMADTLVQREPIYDNVVRSLLGGTAVVEDLDSAIRLSRRYPHRYRMVTLDGQLMSNSGAMTGGSLNKNTGILSRKNEIARLRQALEEKSGDLKELAGQVQKAQGEWKKAENDAQAAQEEKNQAQAALQSLEARQSQHALLLGSLRQALEGLLEEQGGAQERRRTLETRLAENKQAREEAAEKREEAARHLEALQAESQELLQRRRTLEEQLLEKRAEKVQEDSRLGALEQSLCQLEELLHSLSGDREERQRELEELSAEETVLSRQMEEKEAVKKEYAALREKKQSQLETLAEEKLCIEGQRTQNGRQAQEKNDEILRMEREKARLEGKASQLQLEEKQVLDTMWESYELTPTAAQQIQKPMESRSEAQRRLGQLRGEIKKLGPVNIGAIEEYQKVYERYQFLEEQRRDLEKAKGDLLDIIGDLTQNMREIFGREFVRIDKHFGETFQELFGGGKAWLQLEEGEDILECGIDIHVELPGKSQRAMSLLSGGEKALVAIVLYFAILKVRPTPFCVLDEIEAALDDVNVLRYVGYMRRLCQSTQFILITHRRGTMEGSDILYGVTMQEQGVTKLLRLQLSQVEEKLGVSLQEKMEE